MYCWIDVIFVNFEVCFVVSIECYGLRNNDCCKLNNLMWLKNISWFWL